MKILNSEGKSVKRNFGKVAKKAAPGVKKKLFKQTSKK